MTIYRPSHTKDETHLAFPPWAPTWNHLLQHFPQMYHLLLLLSKGGGDSQRCSVISHWGPADSPPSLFFIHLSSQPPLSPRNRWMKARVLRPYSRIIGVQLFKMPEAFLGNIVRVITNMIPKKFWSAKRLTRINEKKKKNKWKNSFAVVKRLNRFKSTTNCRWLWELWLQ